ncbi:MAG: hypothetical protein CMJ83_17005 [Planctomycetes bacterium]|nr:hypothetical protein [Planctomycetota bacterium]
MAPNRNHLLLTESIAAKGDVTPCAGRLVDHLGNSAKPVLNLVNVEITWLLTGETEEVAELVLKLDQVLFAHEYVAMSSDPHLAAMSTEEQIPSVRISMVGASGLRIGGRMRNSSLEWQRPFMVMQRPQIELLRDDAARLASQLQDLPYLLVNRDRIEAFFVTE